jgi:hypothetical protein
MRVRPVPASVHRKKGWVARLRKKGWVARMHEQNVDAPDIARLMRGSTVKGRS